MEFRQAVWNEDLLIDWLLILDLARREDLGAEGDCTTQALVPDDSRGRAAIVARKPGVLAGAPAIAATLARFNPDLKWSAAAHDAQPVAPGHAIGIVEGPARAMLTVERPL